MNKKRKKPEDVNPYDAKAHKRTKINMGKPRRNPKDVNPYETHRW